ncbi:potassium/sodium hyperpolarization-activated cyclic nucleotide-gated channel 1-like [Zerene cesonia]|uniref:potassium/sodium hyperpolarization-activated cyclic nucleotide-gated channel 1-like n=1 Tax=Zerene cesonia TaxID=33412 RepID=UPI0018E55A5C|nr:potassium/sodium hyperpolarization-activated cyclic nucleotide-gated channel 1-like [Zerene cesonia]
MLTPRLSTVTPGERGLKSDTETSHGYFHGHKCYLPTSKVITYEIKCGPLKRLILDLVTVEKNDPRARKLYKSHASLCANQYMQYKDYPWSIHPYSTFRIWLEGFLSVTILLSNILLAVHYSKTNPGKHIYEERALLTFDSIYLINIVLNFFTGYIVGDTNSTVVLDLKRILFKYTRTWFIPDLMTVSILFLKMIDYQDLPVELFMVSLKMIRLIHLISYVKNITTKKEVRHCSETALEVMLLLLSFLSWNMYLQYAVEYMSEGVYTPSSPRACSWITIVKLWNATSTTRFVFSLDRAVGMLRGNANINILEKDGCFETFYIVSWCIAQVLVLHCAFKYVITIFGSESARAQYFIMSKQVEMYLNQKRFPTRIKNKVLKFYAIGYQSHFFAEFRMMSCVSGQLREDIIMHTGRQLVRDVTFLKQLPGTLLLQIGIKLRIVIFIAGDIIMKIKTIGDCLYFIHKGTVAIYCESGKEVCHLEDGDFFGEIALVMSHRLRTASAVAVTNCELFRLDREDFESYVACYPTVYEDIKKVATDRYERSKTLDEHHKIELSMKKKKKLETEYDSSFL